jgi:hypothetical protein
LRTPQPEIAVLSDPLDAFDYFVTGQAAGLLRGGDRSSFLETLWKNGLAFDILTVDDVRLAPDRLGEYAAILIANEPRLPQDVAQALDAYRDDGGGLFVGGRTGIFDELGYPDTTALETLLDLALTGLQNTGYDTWIFDSTANPLLDDLQGVQYADDNLYYIPTFNPIAAGYTPLGRLVDTPLVVTAGYKDKTVFWFPRLTSEDPEHLAAFQRNLWSFFGVEPRVSAPGSVELAGEDYLSLFTPISQTVQVRYPPTMTSALVWDWNAMELVGPVPLGPRPALTLHAEANSTAFLGTFWPGDEPQVVALSGASLARTAYGAGTFQVALYRAAPGMQIQVAIDTGGLPVLDAFVQGGGLDHTSHDRSGPVYVVQATPSEERLTVAIQVRQPVFLPLVVQDS